MARTRITPQTFTGTGAAITWTNADQANGMVFANRAGKSLLLIKNADASDRTITIQVQNATRPADGNWPAQTVGDLTLAVVAGTEAQMGPFPLSHQTNGGDVELDFSSGTDTDTKVAVLQVA